MTVVVIPDDFPSLLSGTEALNQLRSWAEVRIYTEKASSAEELRQRLKEARVAINIRAYSKFDGSLFQACPDLKLISVLGIGTDNIDLAAASRAPRAKLRGLYATMARRSEIDRLSGWGVP